jgi:cysteine sulfinate desulfinase/cysteine desulfurase-like protein
MEHNIICSIGSACHTGTKGASHVLHSMKAPFIVRCGVIRISFGDNNTLAECDKFCKILMKGLAEQD